MACSRGLLLLSNANGNANIVPCSAGQLGRKLREWNVYKYDSKHRPMDLDKLSDDTIVERTLSVVCHEANPRDPRSEYSPAVPTTTPLPMEYNNSSLEPDFRNNPYNIASANHIAMSKEEQSSLDAKLSISPRAFDQSVLADANGTYTGPITVTGPSVMLSPSGNIPSEDGLAMDTDMDRISITSLALSSISGFASLRSLARRIRMDRITKASSEDRSMNDVPSSAMQWDTSSKNSLRLFGRFSMSSLSVASSRKTDTSQMSWRPEALSTIEEDDGYTAKHYQREEILLPRLPSALQDTSSVRRGLDEEHYIPMAVQRVQAYYGMRDLMKIGYGRLDLGVEVDAVWERFLEEPDYKYVRKNNTGFIRLGEIELQPVGNIPMQWHVMGKDDRVYFTDFVIIPKDVPVNSDFVLGRCWKSRWCQPPDWLARAAADSDTRCGWYDG